jgi:hypothetical protein
MYINKYKLTINRRWKTAQIRLTACSTTSQTDPNELSDIQVRKCPLVHRVRRCSLAAEICSSSSVDKCSNNKSRRFFTKFRSELRMRPLTEWYSGCFHVFFFFLQSKTYIVYWVDCALRLTASVRVYPWWFKNHFLFGRSGWKAESFTETRIQKYRHDESINNQATCGSSKTDVNADTGNTTWEINNYRKGHASFRGIKYWITSHDNSL